MCYGYFYGLNEGLEELTIQVTYCNLDTEEVRRFQVIKTMEELKEWFMGLIHEYVKWADIFTTNVQRRDESHERFGVSVPLPRKGRGASGQCTLETESRGGNYLSNTETGIGKTLSTVFPSLKAIGEGHGDKLFI